MTQNSCCHCYAGQAWLQLHVHRPQTQQHQHQNQRRPGPSRLRPRARRSEACVDAEIAAHDSAEAYSKVIVNATNKETREVAEQPDFLPPPQLSIKCECQYLASW